MCLWRQCNKDPSASLGMTVLGERIGSQGWCAAFFYWAMSQSAFLVTSHSYDTREGIVSHVWCQILQLSPHLFWLGLFSHRAFSSAQDDDTGERKGSHLGDMLRVLELAVLYTIRVAPWRRAAPKAQDRVPRRGTTPRSGVKNYVRLPVSLKRHEGRSGGIFLADQ